MIIDVIGKNIFSFHSFTSDIIPHGIKDTKSDSILSRVIL